MTVGTDSEDMNKHLLSLGYLTYLYGREGHEKWASSMRGDIIPYLNASDGESTERVKRLLNITCEGGGRFE